MNIAVTTNSPQYAAAIRRYATETGKETGEALAREGPDFRLELFRQFREIHPVLGSIFAAARAREYRVARTKGSFLSPILKGVSKKARERARKLLGKQKSDLFRFVGSGVQGFGLAPVRFSARGRNKRLQGGRTGWRFAKSALRAYKLDADVLAERVREERQAGGGLRRLNLRALSVHYELLYRERAAAGGTMAVQWIHKTWRRGSRSRGRMAQLVQRSNTGVGIGTVNFSYDRAGNLSDILFTGYVPGTGEQANRRGVVNRVFALRSAALLNAIRLHHEKAKRTAGMA